MAQGMARDVERVGHGVRAIESPETVAMLKDTGTVLEVCPSSNVCLGVAPSIETHQLRGLHKAGVAVTLNSDDPSNIVHTIRSQLERNWRDLELPAD